MPSRAGTRGRATARAQAIDLFAEELRLAQAQLSGITGAFSSDDFLGGDL